MQKKALLSTNIRPLYSVLCTLYSVLCTLYSVLCTLYSVLCTLYSVLYPVLLRLAELFAARFGREEGGSDDLTEVRRA
jgi:amino acid permease